jgi:hypothetical protein
VAVRFFAFVQMEFPWELGPADGRYLLREKGGENDGRPQRVVVLGTIGARRRRLLGRGSHTRRTSPEPATVAVARATVIDPVSLPAEAQARAWLSELDPEHEARSATATLNSVLFAYRTAAANPHVHELAPAQALVVRAGYGDGEQVADGHWTSARELVLSRKRSGRRALALRPQERLAVLLSGRGEALLCEELALRARLDLDEGRSLLAAICLERAYAAALVELPRERHADLTGRIEELKELRPGVQDAARAALDEDQGVNPTVEASIGTTIAAGRERDDIDERTVRHALERLEAALRARTAPGFAAHER